MRKSILSLTILILILLTLGINSQARPTTTKKKGIISKVTDAAAYGFGWQLGKEGAKEVIKKGKEIANDPKTKERIKNLKEKTKKIINNNKNKKRRKIQ